MSQTCPSTVELPSRAATIIHERACGPEGPKPGDSRDPRRSCQGVAFRFAPARTPGQRPPRVGTGAESAGGSEGGRDGDRPGPARTPSPRITRAPSRGPGLSVAARTPPHRHTHRQAMTGLGQALTRERGQCRVPRGGINTATASARASPRQAAARSSSGQRPCSEGRSLDQRPTDDVQLWFQPSLAAVTPPSRAVPSPYTASL